MEVMFMQGTAENGARSWGAFDGARWNGEAARSLAPTSKLMSLDPLSRNVYGFLGIVVDATSLPSVIRQLTCAATVAKPFVLSTPNLNFLALSQSDAAFRETLLMSDLCPADGMPIVWLGRLLSVPLQRVSGSDIFDAMKLDQSAKRPIKVLLFGGTDGIGSLVADKINSVSASMRCVGAIDPGYGNVEQLSDNKLIEQINASKADLLAIFLSAKKAQMWIARNHARLSVPVRASLGATINFQAGTIRRAPAALQRLGLEWLWRIKEEPYLWQRYAKDGVALLRTLLTSVLPLTVYDGFRKQFRPKASHVELSLRDEDSHVVLSIRGVATAATVDEILPHFRNGIARRKDILVDFSEATAIDARVLGLVIMLRKVLRENGLQLTLTCTNRMLRWIIGRHGFSYLLT